MKLYNCIVRLQGDVKDEVAKSGVTSAEIKVLKNIHGGDAVHRVVRATDEDGDARSVERTEAQERDRLSALYGEGKIISMFGAPVQKIEEDLAIDDEDEDEAPQPKAKAKRSLPKVRAGDGADPIAVAAQATSDSNADRMME